MTPEGEAYVLDPGRRDEVERLQTVATAHGCELDERTAERVWSEYSDTFAAGWLSMGEAYTDDVLWAIIEERTKTLSRRLG
jgi:hypothetical protein